MESAILSFLCCYDALKDCYMKDSVKFARYHGKKICDKRGASYDSWDKNCWFEVE